MDRSLTRTVAGELLHSALQSESGWDMRRYRDLAHRRPWSQARQAELEELGHHDASGNGVPAFSSRADKHQHLRQPRPPSCPCRPVRHLVALSRPPLQLLPCCVTPSLRQLVRARASRHPEANTPTAFPLSSFAYFSHPIMMAHLPDHCEGLAHPSLFNFFLSL